MRIILLPIAALALVAADDAAVEAEAEQADIPTEQGGRIDIPPALLLPSYQLTSRQLEMIAEAQIKAAEPLETPSSSEPPSSIARMLADGEISLGEINLIGPSSEECRDRITRAREAFGKPPMLEREPASPDKPHLIYAVDRRQDGCSVMVMKGDPDDIRQLPGKMEGSLLIPARDVGN